jgi:hypothetical protein
MGRSGYFLSHYSECGLQHDHKHRLCRNGGRRPTDKPHLVSSVLPGEADLEGVVVKKAIIGFGPAMALILVALFAAPPTGLSVEGFRILCLVVAAVILWCMEVIPVIVTSVLLAVAIPALGIETAKEAFAS